jgi:uncharacterized protein
MSAAVALLAFAGAAIFAGGCGSDDASSTVSVVATTESGSSETTAGTSPDAGSPGDTSAPDATALAGSAVPGSSVPSALPQGFTTIEARITAADGEVCEVCLWLADTDEERGRGLMGVTDLGPAGGMAFVFDPATTGAFYMFQTPTPLSIAWFGEDGRWVGSADMAPCMDATPARCELYSPDGAAYTVAVETFEDDLEALLLVEGSTIELLAGSENLECQTPSS